jgi:hypothetical protein
MLQYKSTGVEINALLICSKYGAVLFRILAFATTELIWFFTAATRTVLFEATW